MSFDELNTAIEWAADEGWNPGLNDADFFWNTDPEGFVKVELNGEMIGSGSIVSYNGEFGFMGFFILKPEYRGRGIGSKFWYYRRDKLLKRLKPNAAIGMDGVFDMQSFYAKGGFKFSHRNIRMEGFNIQSDMQSDIQLFEVSEFSDEELLKFDRGHFGFDRNKFIIPWLKSDKHYTLGTRKDGRLAGIGTVRKCRKGFKIGPLFADVPEIAEQIFIGLLNKVNGDYVYLDVPEINIDAMSLAQKYNMSECFGCARMYFGEAPMLPHKNIYGVTTFELG